MSVELALARRCGSLSAPEEVKTGTIRIRLR
jgi:hypothetical protein